MILPINKVFLDQQNLSPYFKDYFVVDSGVTDKGKTLSKLSNINLFVGPNNSGKSRFLRGLSKWADTAFDTTAVSDSLNPELKTIGQDLAEEVMRAFAPYGYSDSGAVLESIRKVTYLEAPLTAKSTYLQFGTVFDRMKNFNGESFAFAPTAGIRISMNENIKGVLINRFRILAREAEKKIHTLLPEWDQLYSFQHNRVYIPSLRGFRPLGKSFDPRDDIYEERTRLDYFSQPPLGNEPLIFTGHNLYSELTLALLGEQSERDFVRDFQEFISKAFFGGQDFQLIPRIPRSAYEKGAESNEYQKEVHVKIGGVEKPIHHLGDGIQQIILLLFQVYKLKDQPSLFFIEEPELFLHAGMQRLLVQQFIKSSQHQFFLATHSNHLLDATLDLGEKISVYMLKKSETSDASREADFHIMNMSSGDKMLLRELGVKTSSVFLSNCTIWVEGITDRLYVRHWLELYKKHLLSSKHAQQDYIEDLHYSFVEYAGSNITHWSFFKGGPKPKIDVEKLCGTILLIADSDGEKKHERLEIIKQSLGDRFVKLPRREIENMLSKDVLLKVLQNQYGELSRNLRSFEEKDYAKVYLGEFIENVIIKSKKMKKRKGSYKKKPRSGTISDKNTFCDASILEMSKWDDLSKPAKDLTQRIYEFIVKHNTDTA